MKNKLKIFNGLLLILFSVGVLMAQTPTSTRIPLHDRMQTKRDKDQRDNVPLRTVVVKIEGNRLLGVRSLGEKKELRTGEIEAKAVTDGDSMIIAFENKLNRKGNEEIVIEKEIVLDEETSKALGSNVFSVLDGKYKVEGLKSSESNETKPYHGRLRSLFNPNPGHWIFKTIRLPNSDSFIEIEVSNLDNGKNTPKSVLVTIIDGNLRNIKTTNGKETPVGRDVYSAKASFINNQLFLEFDKPFSREEKVELQTKGDIIGDKETYESLGVCSCSEGKILVKNANGGNPTVAISVAATRPRHRWLFRRTTYDDPNTRCHYSPPK